MTFALAFLLQLAAAQPATVTRQEMLSRSDAFARLSWQMGDANRKGKNCPADYVSDYLAGTQTGMPYKWGGFDDEASFRAGLTAGKGAGSHKSNGTLDCVVGLDCSGFVSRVWGLSRHVATSQLNSAGSAVKTKDLKPGDALNKPGSHVVLFAGFRDDGVPIFFEASGAAKKVRLNTSASWAYLNGYSPLRYGAVADETPNCAGTSDKPIEVTGFPFTDKRSTFLACSDRFDEYSCKRGTSESGREVIYRLTVTEPATVVARVSSAVETDVDLHLLSKLDADACVARGDTSLKTVVGPGTWFLVADTWTDQENLERSGEYTLELRLDAAPPPDAGTAAPVDAGAGATGTAPVPAEPKKSGCAAVPGVVLSLVLVGLGVRRKVRRRW